MNFDLTPDQISLVETARNFSQKEIAPFASEWDQKKFFPKDVIRRAADMGFCGLYTREDVGGMNLGRLNATLIFEELAGGCASTTAYITIHNMVTWMIDQFAPEALRQEWCPKMTSAEVLGSYCLTEPNSGSDAASLGTRAVKDANGYTLTGSKAFVSGGGETQVLVVMARTGDDTPSGISAFLVPANSPGISFGENEKKMGWNSQPTRMINFDGVKIPHNHLLGKEGEGFKIAMKGLDGGRINIGICSVGAAQTCIHLAQQHMLERKQFGKALSSFQALQFKLADMVSDLTAARQMIRLAAFKIDSQAPTATVYSAMAKRFATDVGFKVCNDAMQIFGGYGYTQEYQIERFLRDVRVHQILEGTNEIMRVITSRKLLEEGATKTFTS